jgi:tryptophanyl-tRNA synthetase
MCGFQRYDKVLWKGVECFIFGRRTSGHFALKKLDGTKMSSSAKASEITLIESAKTLLRERMRIHPRGGLAAKWGVPRAEQDEETLRKNNNQWRDT